MGKSLYLGKGGEIEIAGMLISEGFDIYLPYVDTGVDFILRYINQNRVRYVEFQVKTMKTYNRILGVKEEIPKNRLHLIYYRHKDEIFYLLPNQVLECLVPNSERGDMIFNKEKREKYATQDMKQLIEFLKSV